MPYPENITGFDLGYVVGLFEGEGTVAFSHTLRLYHKKTIERYFVHVAVNNTNKKLLDKLCKITGIGRITLVQRRPRFYYDWRLWAQREVLWFLEQYFPYLVEKNIRAALVMKFLRSRINHFSLHDSPYKRKYSQSERNLHKKFLEGRKKHRAIPKLS